MNLENSLKFHFCKSSQLNDSPRSTSSETLTGTDVMAGMGMVQQRAKMGFSAFMGKMGVSSNDREKAIELLTAYALEHCDKVAALRKLDSDIKPKVMQVLATFAFADYSRSASSTRTCDCCSGNGFIEVEVFAMKTSTPKHAREIIKMSKECGVKIIPSQYELRREIRATERVICNMCSGKGVVSSHCKDCKGRGTAINQVETKKQGVPVISYCKRCGGVGYHRLPSTECYEAISHLTDAITLDTWKKSVKRFYDELITKFDIEEAWADSQLKKVTG